MKLTIPPDEWVVMQSKYRELPFGEHLLKAFENVAVGAETIMSADKNNIAKQREHWNKATDSIKYLDLSSEIYSELLLLIVTVWGEGEWFFTEVLSPIEQHMFYATMNERMKAAAEYMGGKDK